MKSKIGRDPMILKSIEGLQNSIARVSLNIARCIGLLDPKTESQ